MGDVTSLEDRIASITGKPSSEMSKAELLKFLDEHPEVKETVIREITQKIIGTPGGAEEMMERVRARKHKGKGSK